MALPLPRRDRPLDWINTGSVPQRDLVAKLSVVARARDHLRRGPEARS
jgi:hypothetical protein